MEGFPTQTPIHLCPLNVRALLILMEKQKETGTGVMAEINTEVLGHTGAVKIHYSVAGPLGASLDTAGESFVF